MQIRIMSYPIRPASLLLICLCGCVSPRALRLDYEGYTEQYGDSNDRELLLNLARLSESEPVAFVQLAQISSGYTLNTSLGVTPNYTFRHAPASVQGSISAGLIQNPVFTFVPLTGSNLVQAVLAPISPKVYMTLYDQGYPADLIARTMIASVEHRMHKNNVATSEFWVNDPHDPTYYKFLEFCANLRNAQLSHALTVDTAMTNVTIFTSTNAKLAEVVGAIQAPGISVSADARNVVTVTQANQNTRWSTNQPHASTARIVENGIKTKRTYDSFEHPNEAIQDARKVATDIYRTNIILKTRTVEAAMYSVAKQEGSFKQLMGLQEQGLAPDLVKISYTKDSRGLCAIVHDHGREIKVRPTMTLTSIGTEPSPVIKEVSVNYNKRTFFVGDEPGVSQNRTVFTMLSYLFAQTAISTQNLPVQQLIRVQ